MCSLIVFCASKICHIVTFVPCPATSPTIIRFKLALALGAPQFFLLRSTVFFCFRGIESNCSSCGEVVEAQQGLCWLVVRTPQLAIHCPCLLLLQKKKKKKLHFVLFSNSNDTLLLKAKQSFAIDSC